MNTANTEHSRDVVNAINRWTNAKDAIRERERDLSHAQTEEKNATNELAKLLLPEKILPDEAFNIWVHINDLDKLLTVRRVSPMNDYEIKWRV